MLKIIVGLFIFTFFGSVLAQNQNERSETAKSFIESLAKSDFSKTYGYFGESVKSQIPFEALPQIRQQIVSAFGNFVKNIEAKEVSAESISLITEFEKSTVNFSIIFDASGKIISFTVADSKVKNPVKYEAPGYANPALFEEKEVTVGSGEWALPATLTMPKSKTNLPAVVLVHGSGPNDRDETVGGNKVFKDLAWGLASRGIAVLRYDKRTFVHGAKMGKSGQLTVNEETADDAVFAVDLLRKTANIDGKKIYVLGHSLGGMMIPRIAQRDSNIAGLIVFAGSARKFEDIYVEQIEYLYSLDGTISADEKAEIDELKKQAENVKKLKATDSPQMKTMLNLPVSYWVDLNNYNPSETAKTIKQPMLIMQGESDYQVTMKDFALWKNALGKRKNVVFKTYPKLFHSFMESLGDQPSPKDYDQISHVKQIVVEDISNWILKMPKK